MSKTTKKKSSRQQKSSSASGKAAIKQAHGTIRKTSSYTKKRAKKYYKDVYELQKAGLVSKTVSRDINKQSKVAKRAIIDFAGVLEGVEKVVLIPNSIAEKLIDTGLRIVSGRGQTVRTKGGEREKASRAIIRPRNPRSSVKFDTEKGIRIIEPNDNGTRTVTQFTAWNSTNLIDLMNKIDSGDVVFADGYQYGFLYYGNESHQLFINAKTMVNYLRKYDYEKDVNYTVQFVPKFQLIQVRDEAAPSWFERSESRSKKAYDREKEKRRILRNEKRRKRRMLDASQEVRNAGRTKMTREERLAREAMQHRLGRQLLKQNNPIAWIVKKDKDKNRKRRDRARNKNNV